MRCPVCHDVLGEVKSTLVACSASEAPPAGVGLEARILMKTMPETAITCAEFEDYLTDYLDGFLVAPLYHRWERHAALCESCSELPGDVVRSIGACYTYKQDELALPNQPEPPTHPVCRCSRPGTTRARTDCTARSRGSSCDRSSSLIITSFA